MKSIDIIGLKNFRIFDDQAGFLQELSGINILTGANNSGKSSIIKSLQMLKNSSNANQFPLCLDLNQQEHLLGDFDNVLFNKDNREIEVSLPFPFLGIKNLFISLRYTVPTTKNTFKASLRAIAVIDKKDSKNVFSFVYREVMEEERRQHKEKFDKEREEFKARMQSTEPPKNDIFSLSRFPFLPPYNPLVAYVEWSLNLEKLKGYLVDLQNFYLQYIENRQKWIGLDKIDEKAKDIFFIPSVLVNSFEKEVDAVSWDNLINEKIGGRKDSSGQEPVGEWDFDSEEFFIPPPQIEDILYYSVLKILRNELIWNTAESNGTSQSIMENCFKSSWETLTRRIATVSYISNIKEENSRIYNANINSPFVNLLKDYTILDSLDTTFISKYLKKFEIGKGINIIYDPKYQLISVSITTSDGAERELVDFGYGIKQLVLILIQISVLAEKNRRMEHEYHEEQGEIYQDYYNPTILLVEEPESNLHPKWQSLLAEMFAEANTIFKIQLVIETHSEYLIRNFQTLVAKETLPSDTVKLFYLRNLHKVTADKHQVESLFIQADGSIDYKIFDGGFFDESNNLEFSLLNVQRDNFLKDFETLKQSNTANTDIITQLQQKIDDFMDKIDLSSYSRVVYGRFDTTKLSPVSVNYLVSGQFLLNNIDIHDDFSPVILQYGRAIENELLQFFVLVSAGGRWTFGKMQAGLQESIDGTTNMTDALRGFTGPEFAMLGSQLGITFTNQANLRTDLINDLREIRNTAGHPGHINTKQDASNYISVANEFLDKWIAEKN